MSRRPSLGDCLSLRSQLEEFVRLKAPVPKAHASLPPVAGGRRSELEVVDLGEALTATLTAVAAAARQLGGEGVGLDLGGEPLTFKLHGELTHFDPLSGRIRIRVRPETKETTHGQETQEPDRSRRG